MIPSTPEQPLPRVTERLQWFLDVGVAVGTVLDVGVQGGTPFLQHCLPRTLHLLFEPVDLYFQTIREKYAETPHELVHAAISDTDGTVWLHGYSRDGSGRVTHSHVADAPAEPGSVPNLVRNTEVPRLTLDTALAGRTDALPYLLKVDVDGHEPNILRGAARTLERVSMVVVESPVAMIRGRIEMLNEAGFELVDIVDLCYYHRMLSQADLIFVHRSWIARCEALRPWQTRHFSWEAWQSLSRHRAFEGL